MGLQVDADAAVSVQQGLQEEVGLLFEPVQVRLGAPVEPVELLGSEGNVQQARLAEDVVGVAEALPLGVAVAVAQRGRLRADISRGGRLGKGDCLALGDGAVRDTRLRFAGGGRRPLLDRAAAGAPLGRPD